jgi:protein-S-isoprenylcysteine O-methyltransferase Ste14
MSDDPKSIAFIVIEFICLLYLFISGQVIPNNALSSIFMVVGFFIAFWAIWDMRASTFKLTSAPHHKATLVTTGPYKILRHPMYAGVILVALSLLFNFFTLPRLIIFIILCVAFFYEVQHEEGLLKSHFKDQYNAYLKNTFRLIPFVY